VVLKQSMQHYDPEDWNRRMKLLIDTILLYVV